ncbi:hypothetical protein SB6421_01636 [Klebsiella huaxiensis]|uniref:Fimbrial protein n=1 Tax=Klebsiella huaxiensis TaxID=2153354 RepID=A0ABT6E8T1_9ENTR|nr:fimbrial protein [Klebsiella huaxiensis]MDG1641800.1 fimbrial protein [Klebsiella huaxiensis]VUT18188.1 hypothetical protein SB6421_01636 [Klebsiella huaxiensis]
MTCKNMLWSSIISFIMLSANTHAIDGTIIFKSTLTIGACKVHANTHSTPATMLNDISLAMPAVSASNLNGSVSFIINVNCYSEQINLDNVKIRFTSDSANENGILLNTAANGASNIGIRIATATGVPIKINAPGERSAVAPHYSSSYSSLQTEYIASYQKLNEMQEVNAGPVESMLNYEVIYF